MANEIKMFTDWCRISWSYMKGCNKIYVAFGIVTRYYGYRKLMTKG